LIVADVHEERSGIPDLVRERRGRRAVAGDIGSGIGREPARLLADTITLRWTSSS
jgi:hypothetical protein